MRKKDYELIAKTLNWARSCGIDTIGIVQDLAIKFALDNPKFDRQKFLIACGIESPMLTKAVADRINFYKDTL
jgi:hypothetical protein